MWLCECKCGEKKDVPARRLVNKLTKSCGCLRRRGFPERKIDLTGEKFDRLKVLRALPREPGDLSFSPRTVKWLCKCKCGNEIVAIANNLHAKKVRSCGCLRDEACTKTAKSRAFPDLQSAKNYLFHMYTRGAEKRELEFSLSKEEFLVLTSQNCHYCGIEPLQKVAATANNPDLVYFYNGVDRKDNAIGYTLQNCTPCCGKCNFLKRSTSYEVFVARIRRIAEHMSLVNKITNNNQIVK